LNSRRNSRIIADDGHALKSEKNVKPCLVKEGQSARTTYRHRENASLMLVLYRGTLLTTWPSNRI
jgi:hypothetical protein